jgi:VanZ family protein
MKEKGRKIAIWSVVVLWMIVIFKLSSQSGEQSNDLSLGVTGLIAALIEKINPSSDALAFNHIIRKCAHFFAYLVLGMVVLFAMRKMGISGTKGILLTMAVCVVYAISDEWHQGFIPGRTPKLTDILIDSCGSLLGTILYSRVLEKKWELFRPSKQEQ